MLKHYFKAFAITLSCFSAGIMSGVVVANETQTPTIDPYDGFYTFSLNLHRIQNDYVSTVETKSLIYHAISGMMNALDEHSRYFPPEQYSKLQAHTNQWSVGVGVQVNNEKIITEIVPHGPASIAGLMVGDQFSGVNGQSLDSWSVGNLYSAFKQDKGTTIEVEILRDLEPIQTSIVVDDVPTINFSIQPIQPGYVYLSIKRFAGGISKDILAALDAVERNDEIPLKGIVLDLRNNPGGNVLEGIQIADAFLESGLISTISYKDETDSQSHKAVSSNTDLLTPKVAVLVNEQSASAAELLAGALQFHKRATVVGTPTFGKGSVQKMYTSDTEALKLTVGRFTAGESIISKEHPVNPDIYVTQNHSDPKTELENRIQQSTLSVTEKTIMTQYLSQLSSEQDIAPIPWHKDFAMRIELDPVLQQGWSAVKP